MNFYGNTTAKEVVVLKTRPQKEEISQTGFCVSPIYSPELLYSDAMAMMLVHNVSDYQIAAREYEKLLREGFNPEAPLKMGKYGAFGMPGGGIISENLESAKSGAEREVRAETGLKVLRCSHLFTDGKFILKDSRTGEVVRQFFYKMDKKPNIKITSRRLTGIENPVHIFIARLDFEKSNLLKVMLKERDRLIAEGLLTREEVMEYGVQVYFKDLDENSVQSLGIEEIEEIDGIGIIPVPTLQSLLEEYLIRLRAKELPIEEREIYVSHLMWMDKALKQIEVAGI